MGKIKDMTNKRFGRLTVVEFSHTDKNNSAVWTCVCDCGTIKNVDGRCLRNGDTASCSCLHLESVKTHGLSNTRIAGIHDGISQRCFNQNNKDYPNYGGRGIKMCKLWKDNVKEFIEWAFSNGYKDGLFIDRIDNNGNYEPSNCRFVTVTENNRNKRNNVYYTNEVTGETKCASEWSLLIGGNRTLVHNRIQAGWGIQRAITERINPIYLH